MKLPCSKHSKRLGELHLRHVHSATLPLQIRSHEIRLHELQQSLAGAKRERTRVDEALLAAQQDVATLKGELQHAGLEREERRGIWRRRKDCCLIALQL